MSPPGDVFWVVPVIEIFLQKLQITSCEMSNVIVLYSKCMIVYDYPIENECVGKWRKYESISGVNKGRIIIIENRA